MTLLNDKHWVPPGLRGVMAREGNCTLKVATASLPRVGIKASELQGEPHLQMAELALKHTQERQSCSSDPARIQDPKPMENTPYTWGAEGGGPSPSQGHG